jgi:hypothetical protein
LPRSESGESSESDESAAVTNPDTGALRRQASRHAANRIAWTVRRRRYGGIGVATGESAADTAADTAGAAR